MEDHKDHQQDDTHDDDNVDDEDDADDDDDHDDDDYADGGYVDCEGGVYFGGRDSSDDDNDNGDDGDDDGTRSQHASNVSNETWRKRSPDLAYVKRKRASFAKKCYFAESKKVLLKRGIRFSLSFLWSTSPIFFTQVYRPLAYGVRISSKASTTAVWVQV